MKQTIVLTIILFSTLVFAEERYHPVDTNQNNVIEQSEFDTYNKVWRSDTLWPSTGKLIPTNYLTRAGHLLLNGGSYKDSGGDMPMCWIPGPVPEFTNSIGMTFVYIKPGTFIMGSPLSEPGRYSDETQHQVTLTKGYYMQTTEVTQAQWSAIMESTFKDECGDNCPVYFKGWNDSQEFISKLNQYEKTNKYRLPTEAEWEYAARAGSTSAFASGGINETECGDPNLNAMGWYCLEPGFFEIRPVAQKQANAWGVFDMHGNVYEWCNDWYGAYPDYSETDPIGPLSGTHRVARGGCWASYARSCRSANRANYWTPDGGGDCNGFRLVRTLEP